MCIEVWNSYLCNGVQNDFFLGALDMCRKPSVTSQQGCVALWAQKSSLLSFFGNIFTVLDLNPTDQKFIVLSITSTNVASQKLSYENLLLKGYNFVILAQIV